ncbi:MAG: endonuclease III [Clostridia bacterium]|nr:endonuclease III [Clostridia bacterium]MBQ7913992.1 endonuclease III [Clostridia bacterium]MBQ8505796.1 endonuclease III [Clostridia bacterium]MBQ8772319.1 endonuclease III [Clostridia bacterium]MBQ8872389.1 endonuclease III [Clostridia bacterium]
MNNCQQILEQLQRDFPNAQSELNFNNPYELIVAVILSAQCTDKRVNQVTPKLFELAPTPQALADMPLDLLEDTIRSCGFYHNKAKHLKSMAADVVSKYGGQVPSNLADLQTLAGVGRKTANVVYAVAFGGQAIAVDTHVFRVANRLGIATATNVLDTEKQLMAVIPQDRWADSHHHILLHGRYVCKAQKPNCAGCSVSQWCRYFKEHND